MMKKAYEMILEERKIQAKIFDHGVGIYREEGEEAITVGTILALEPTDILTCYFRGDGSSLRFRGAISLLDEMCWWMGRLGEKEYINATLPSAVTDVEHGIIGTSSSLIGGDMDVSVGVALAQKKLKTGNIVLFMSGDGATSKGNFHEMANWASKFCLPILILVRGNGWAMSTPAEKNTCVSSIPDIVKPFGIKTYECDGNNLEDVYSTVKDAAGYVRSTGPALVYAKTYRMSGHSAHDEDDYRDPAIKAIWKRKDPIINMEKMLISAGLSNDELAAIEEEVTESIEKAYRQALERPVVSAKDYLKKQEEVVNKMWNSAKEI